MVKWVGNYYRRGWQKIMELYPLKLDPIFKDYLWGNGKLKELYGKKTPYEVTAESWEVSCHPNGLSTITNGAFAGKTLQEVVDILDDKLLGRSIQTFDKERFPLLVKFIDAYDRLSIQVHPKDDYAKINENGELGKTEMWYIVDAQEGAQLIFGLKEGTTKEAFAEALKKGEPDEMLNYVPVKKGDMFFVPAGLLHAIGKGILIAEIQQNSDTTYRVFDYNRRDSQGNLRPLHIEKALDVIDFSAHAKVTEGDTISCEYFKTIKADLKGEMNLSADFTIVICTEGNGEIKYNNGTTDFKAGDSLVIPAALGDFTISGEGALLITTIPKK